MWSRRKAVARVIASCCAAPIPMGFQYVSLDRRKITRWREHLGSRGRSPHEAACQLAVERALTVQVRSEDQIFFIVSARRLDACVTPSERKRSKSESQASCSALGLCTVAVT